MHFTWWALLGLPKPPSIEEESKLLEGIIDGQGEFFVFASALDTSRKRTINDCCL